MSIEIMFSLLPVLNILRQNCHILISIGACMLMFKTHRVHKLVLNRDYVKERTQPIMWRHEQNVSGRKVKFSNLYAYLVTYNLFQG